MKVLRLCDLARILHPASSRRLHRAIAVLTAYFDETNTHAQSDVVLICGFVASCDAWEAFEIDWRECLGNLRVDYFHATECEHGEGIFSGHHRPLRESLFVGLAKIIGRHKPVAVNTAIRREDWNQFKNQNIGKQFTDPYHLCFEYSMQKISAWAKENAANEPVALVFGEQKEYEPRADLLYKLYRSDSRWGKQLTSLTFALASNCAGLQASDLYAYETLQYVKTSRKNPNAPLRPAMQIMCDSGVPAITDVQYDPKALPAMLKR